MNKEHKTMTATERVNLTPTVERRDIIIVGSGFAGLGLGSALKRRGIEDFVIIERADDVGGTWRDNRYPGAACDVPSHLYSFSFRPNPEWSRVFSPQVEIQQYLRDTAREEGLLPHLRFGQELLESHWDEQAGVWWVTTTNSTFTCRVLITATGHLSDAKWPAVEGLAAFSGQLMHSAAWDDSLDVSGRRVGVIGTGASAIQIIPELAQQAEHLVVFQRSAPYVGPRHDRAYTEAEKRSFRRAPELIDRLRADFFWDNEARFVERQAVPALLDEIATVALDHLAAQVPDPELRAQLTPDYAIGCKRILKSNDYYPTFNRDNVTLETRPISRVEGDRVVFQDGQSQQLDVIVAATGFEATDLPIAHRVTGRNGARLSEQWATGMQAYRTTSVHNFPNMFVMNGPNTGLGHNSIIYIIESQIDYILGALEYMTTTDASVLEVTAEAETAFAEDLDARSQGTVWLTGGCSNWYVDPRNGRLTTVWPDFAHSFRQENSTFDPTPYVVRELAGAASEVVS
jgi:cation diffusion facilitator CzcD-associated flavoprotein CzcO